MNEQQEKKNLLTILKIKFESMLVACESQFEKNELSQAISQLD